MTCTASNKRGLWKFEFPGQLVHRSDDVLKIECKDQDGNKYQEAVPSRAGVKIVAGAVFLDVGIVDSMTNRHREQENRAMLDELNAIIAEFEIHRDLKTPRIGAGHAMSRGGIFSLLQDPGSPHTAGCGAQRSLVVDIDNDDPTARYCRELYARLGIAKGLITSWNAFGAYGEKPGMQAIRDNLPLCRALVEVARPAALVAQGHWAHKIADSLCFQGPILRVPHPSRLGRASYKRWHQQDADSMIEAAFEVAYQLINGR